MVNNVISCYNNIVRNHHRW